jgi:predicted nucleic acid-binding protein
VDVLVDTSVWSIALRRRESARLSQDEVCSRTELTELVREKRALIIGPIRQEVLSGVRHQAQFDRMRAHLRQFEDSPIDTADFESAAEVGNSCRSKGVIGSPVDFLICAVALSRRWAVFTLDKDFLHFARIAGVHLHSPRNFNPVN